MKSSQLDGMQKLMMTVMIPSDKSYLLRGNIGLQGVTPTRQKPPQTTPSSREDVKLVDKFSEILFLS